jgi:hypothetical protein
MRGPNNRLPPLNLRLSSARNRKGSSNAYETTAVSATGAEIVLAAADDGANASARSRTGWG